MNEKKERLDHLMVAKGLVESREKAKRLIMANQVLRQTVNSQTEAVTKPGHLLPVSTQLVIKDQERFLSRGGYKLLTALEHFQIDVTNVVALDVGASTGGFTDCLLQMGVSKVYSVDVGYGQLHWKLRNDHRVINLERTNIRMAEPDLVPESVGLISIDCSFISIKKVLTACIRYISNSGIIIGLVKPQFELDRGRTSKGVVRSKAEQLKAVQDVIAFAAHLGRIDLQGWVPSSILGPKGNQEYLVVWRAVDSKDSP